jgi:hypothetical protein
MEKKTSRKPRTRKPKSQGLGDTVEKVLQATGIDKLAKFVLGEDCNCEERKQKLNHLFPYIKPECLTEDEYNYLTEWFAVHRNSVKPSEQREILKIYNRTFKQNQEPTSCATCLAEIINKLKKIHENYLN